MMEESIKKSRRRKRSKGSSATTTGDDGEVVKKIDAAVREQRGTAEQRGASNGVEIEDAKEGGGCATNSTDDSQLNTNKKEENGDGDDTSTNNHEEETNTRKRRKRTRKKKSGDSTPDGPENKGVTSQQQQQLQLANSVEHTVFIEGLPFTSTESDIRFFFTSHDCHDIVQLRLPTWQDSGRLRGFGHVVFASQETRLRALSDEVNGKELGGRYITIKEANAPRAGTTAGAVLGGAPVRAQPGGCKTLFVRNLPYDASEDDVRESFQICGKIIDDGVRVVRNHSNGQSKGFGYVEFKNAEGALAAVQKASKPFGLTVLSRPVFVDYDEGAMKGSFRDKEGKLWSKEHTSASSAGSFGAGKTRRGGGGRVGGPSFGIKGGR